MRIAFYTLGCKLNQCETEALASAWRSQGFFVVPWTEEAEFYLFNTCTVTSKSEQKARRVIRKTLKDHPSGIVMVTGCYAEVEADTLQRLFPEAIVVPHTREPRLLRLPEHIAGRFPEPLPVSPPASREGRIPGDLFSAAEDYLCSPEEAIPKEGFFDFAAEEYSFHTRPFVKIQDGCDNRCAYCRVPLARGDSVSLAASRVLSRVQELEVKGYGETVLTGVNISAYSSEGRGLGGLLSLLLRNTDRIRLRLSSLEPNMLEEELLESMGDPRVRPHFHLPVQSGSDRILNVMKRNYTADTVIRAVETLRSIKDDPFIAADIIVGFPGERDEDFQRTYSLLEGLGFSQLHVFPFSRRPGTDAFAMKPHIPERIVKERAEKLHVLSARLYRDYAARWNGKDVEVIVERIDGEKGSCLALAENYLRVSVDPGKTGGCGKGTMGMVTLTVDSGDNPRITGDMTEMGKPGRMESLFF